MLRMGLTGGIATGKSTVSQMMERHGAIVIDADTLAHQVTGKGQPTFEAVIAAFGSSILDSQGEIDRRQLGARVFANPPERETLNRLVHPAVRALLQQSLERYAALEKQAGRNYLVVLSIPLLFETNRSHMVDLTVVVYCPQILQFQRLVSRNALAPEEAWQRIRSQISIEQKAELADEVIDNSRDLEYTCEQVDCLLEKLEWDPAEQPGGNREVYPSLAPC